MSEMVIKAKDGQSGMCGYCRKENAVHISLTFECYICDAKCDDKYYEEYNNALIEANKKQELVQGEDTLAEILAGD